MKTKTPSPGSLPRLVRRRKWRVYLAEEPQAMNGDPWPGPFPMRNGWFWIHNSIVLFVRVRGIEAARSICRTLNAAESND